MGALLLREANDSADSGLWALGSGLWALGSGLWALGKDERPAADAAGLVGAV